MPMYYPANYTADGVQTKYSIPFPYIDPFDIRVYLDNDLTVDYDFFNKDTVEFRSPPASGVSITIKRYTKLSDRWVDFNNNSAIKPDTLNKDSNQNFFLIQEGVGQGLGLPASEFNADAMLELLNGKVTDDQLVVELKTKIDRTDLYADVIDSIKLAILGKDAFINDLYDLGIYYEGTTNFADANLEYRLYHNIIQTAEAKFDLTYLDGEVYTIKNKVNELILLDAGDNLAAINAALIYKADQADLELVTGRVGLAETAIINNEATISLRVAAAEIDLTTITGRVSEAEILIDGFDSRITLKADQLEVTNISNRLSAAEIDINGAEAAIALKASQSEVDALVVTLAEAGIDIDGGEGFVNIYANKIDAILTGPIALVGDVYGDDTIVRNVDDIPPVDIGISKVGIRVDAAESLINLKASKLEVDALGTRLGQAEVNIDGANAAINLKASQTTVDGLTNDLNTAVGRVTAAEIDIDGANSSISLITSDITSIEGELDGVVSELNLTKNQFTVKIDDNDNVTGIGLMLDETGFSSFAVLANQFKIVNPSFPLDKQQVFTVGSLDGVGTVGIDGNLIIDGTINGYSIEELAVGNQHISNDAIQARNIKAGTINAGHIVTDTLTANLIKSDQIEARHLKADIIDASHISTGSIKADMYLELRNTIVYNGDDSLDINHPFEVPFLIPSETFSIVSAKLSFKIMPFRAYSLATGGGGAFTNTTTQTNIPTHQHLYSINNTTGTNLAWSPSDGKLYRELGTSTLSVVSGDGHIHTLNLTTAGNSPEGSFAALKRVAVGSSGGLQVAGGGSFDVGTTNGHSHTMFMSDLVTGYVWAQNASGRICALVGSGKTTPLSTPSPSTHTHQLSTNDHTHGISFGIHQEVNSPTVTVATHNGDGVYSNYASYTTEQIDRDLTSRFSGVGWKGLRFSANARCRISAVLQLKVDINA